MNDSPYGLTASVWTNAEANPQSQEAFEKFAEELETGTVFLNRCGRYFFSVFFFPDKSFSLFCHRQKNRSQFANSLFFFFAGAIIWTLRWRGQA